MKNANFTWDSVANVDGYNLYLSEPIIGNTHSLSFDGVDDYVDCGDIPLTTFDIEFWVKSNVPSTTNNVKQVFTKDRVVFCWNHSNAAFQKAISFNDGSSWYNAKIQSNLEADVWYKIRCVFTGAALEVYLNDVLEQTTPVSNNPASSALDFYIGSGQTGTGVAASFFDGLIDEFTIISGGNLVASYNMNEGSGNTLIDETGNNSGTINGATYSTDVPFEDIQLGDFVKHNTSLIPSPEYTIEDIADGEYEAYVTSELNSIESDPSTTISFTVGNPEVQTFLTNTGIIDATIEAALDTFITGLKDQALWDKVKEIFPVVGGTADTHKWGLKETMGSYVGTVTHSSNGFSFSGSSAFDTGLQFSTLFTDTFYIGGFVHTTPVNSSAYLSGLHNIDITANTERYYHIVRSSRFICSGLDFNDGAWGDDTSTQPNQSYYSMSKVTNSDRRMYRDGVQVGAGLTVVDDGTPPQATIPYGNTKQKDTVLASQNFDGVLNVFVIADGLTPTEEGNMNTLVHQFNTDLGR